MGAVRPEQGVDAAIADAGAGVPPVASDTSGRLCAGLLQQLCPWDESWTSRRTWTRSPCARTAGFWPATIGGGPGSRSSPILRTLEKAAVLRRIHRGVKAGQAAVVEERDLSIYDELFGVPAVDDARKLARAAGQAREGYRPPRARCAPSDRWRLLTGPSEASDRGTFQSGLVLEVEILQRLPPGSPRPGTGSRRQGPTVRRPRGSGRRRGTPLAANTRGCSRCSIRTIGLNAAIAESRGARENTGVPSVYRLASVFRWIHRRTAIDLLDSPLLKCNRPTSAKSSTVITHQILRNRWLSSQS